MLVGIALSFFLASWVLALIFAIVSSVGIIANSKDWGQVIVFVGFGLGCTFILVAILKYFAPIASGFLHSGRFFY